MCRALLTAGAIVGDLQVLDHATAFHAELRRLKVFLLGRFQLLQFLVHLRVKREESAIAQLVLLQQLTSKKEP